MLYLGKGYFIWSPDIEMVFFRVVAIVITVSDLYK
jgi:hypothetical protein